jgi:hypothetical protein
MKFVKKCLDTSIINFDFFSVETQLIDNMFSIHGNGSRFSTSNLPEILGYLLSHIKRPELKQNVD